LDRGPRRLVAGSGVSAGAARARTIAALTTSPEVGFTLQVISGGGMVVVDVLTLTALQENLPRDLLSRVIGILQTVALGAAMAARFVVAALIRAFGLTDVLLIVGVGFAAIAVAGIGSLVRANRPLASAAESAAGHEVLLAEPALVAAPA
jgi:hypothetical protein